MAQYSLGQRIEGLPGPMRKEQAQHRPGARANRVSKQVDQARLA